MGCHVNLIELDATEVVELGSTTIDVKVRPVFYFTFDLWLSALWGNAESSRCRSVIDVRLDRLLEDRSSETTYRGKKVSRGIRGPCRRRERCLCNRKRRG
jgi:hypothetical protein